MRIPDGPEGTPAEGKPTLYVSRLHAYGAGGYTLVDQEAEQGCPRQYRKRYVDHDPRMREESDTLSFGRVIHAALALMETASISPEDALRQAWDQRLGPEWMAEAVEDLDGYLARASDRMSTVATEVDLYGLLYVDEVFGEVWFGGRLDRLEVDVNDPGTLHVRDYKTNRRPVARAAMKGDVQLKSYDWLVRQNWARLMGSTTSPSIVVHLDLVKHYDLDWWYEAQEIEEWAAWCEAIARAILRDEAGDPMVGPGCAWCPVKDDCRAYRALPGQGRGMLERRQVTDLVRMVAWRDEAAETVRLLKAGIDDIDATIAERVDAEGGSAVVGASLFTREASEARKADLRRVHAVLGDQFYDLASVSLTKLDDLSRGDPQLRDALNACIAKEVTGTKITRKKAEG